MWTAVVAPAGEIGAQYCENCHVSNVVADDAPLGMLAEGVRGYPYAAAASLPAARER